MMLAQQDMLQSGNFYREFEKILYETADRLTPDGARVRHEALTGIKRKFDQALEKLGAATQHVIEGATDLMIAADKISDLQSASDFVTARVEYHLTVAGNRAETHQEFAAVQKDIALNTQAKA